MLPPDPQGGRTRSAAPQTPAQTRPGGAPAATHATQVRQDIAGLPLDQQQQQALRPDTSLAENKARVRRKVIDGGGWYDRVSDFTLALARWKSRNWTKYIGATGGNYYVSWNEGQFTNAVTSLIGTVVGTGLTLAATAGLGAIIGTAVAPGVGTVIGAAIGFLVSLIIGGIMTALGNDAAMATVDAALRKAAGKIVKTADGFNAQYDRTIQGTRSERDHALDGIEAAATAQDLAGWETWVDGESALVRTPPPATDMSLYQRLLADRVLQHAGDEEDGNKETNQASYDRNREEVFGVAADDNLVRKDLFTHQAKYEWGRMALDTQGADTRLASLAAADSRRYTAGQVANLYHNRSFTFRGTRNTGATIAKITDDFGRGPLAAQAERQIESNDFELRCTLDLTNQDGAVYIDHFNYFIDLKAPMPRGYSQTANWRVSPD